MEIISGGMTVICSLNDETPIALDAIIVYDLGDDSLTGVPDITPESVECDTIWEGRVDCPRTRCVSEEARRHLLDLHPYLECCLGLPEVEHLRPHHGPTEFSSEDLLWGAVFLDGDVFEASVRGWIACAVWFCRDSNFSFGRRHAPGKEDE